MNAKPVRWIGSSLADLRGFPESVQKEFGYALYFAQIGDKHPKAKPLKGFAGASVLEVATTTTVIHIGRSTLSGFRKRFTCCMCSKRRQGAASRRRARNWR